MPIMYQLDEHAIHCPVVPGEPAVEPEHAPSCDINLMMKNALRGAQVRGSGIEPTYGYDDTTMDAVSFRIQKAEIESQLREVATSHEFTAEELSKFPESVRKYFGFRLKKESNDTPDPSNAKKLNKRDKKVKVSKKDSDDDDPIELEHPNNSLREDAE